jgi:zinc protease
LLRRTYFGNHPYGRSSLGTLASIKAITREDVVKYWQSVLLPRSIVLAVYGDISADEVRRAAEHSFRNFNRAGKLPAPPAPAPQLAKRAVQIQEKPGLAQAVLFYGYPGITVRNADRYAIDVLDAALSGANCPVAGCTHACAIISWCMWCTPSSSPASIPACS